MPPVCDAVINLCAIRATRLDSLGNPEEPPNNVYVSNKPIALAVTPQIEEGRDLTQVSGCDCIVGSYKGPDKFKRENLRLDIAKLEPGLLELLLGAPVILGGTDNSPIGFWMPNQLTCDAEEQPNVALEAWTMNWEDDHQDPVWPWVRWLWTSTRWQIGDHTLNNEFLQPQINGFTRSNPNWGLGIFGDQPEAAPTPGPGIGVFYDTEVPVAECGWQDQELPSP